MAADPSTRASELSLVTEKGNSGTIVRATGRITSTSCAALDKAARDLIGAEKHIVLDLANVDYIDSAGLGTLVSVYMHARRTSCDLRMANPKQRIKDLFNRSGLSMIFDRQSFDALWDAWSSSSR